MDACLEWPSCAGCRLATTGLITPVRNQGVVCRRCDMDRGAQTVSWAGDRWLIGMNHMPGNALPVRCSPVGLAVTRALGPQRPETNRHTHQQNGHTWARTTASTAIPPNIPFQIRFQLQQLLRDHQPQLPRRAPNGVRNACHRPVSRRQRMRRLSGGRGVSRSFRPPFRSGTPNSHTPCRPGHSGSIGRASSSRSPGRGCRTPARNWSSSR